MNNKNFAKWDLTQLLPDRKLFDEDKSLCFTIDEDNRIEYLHRAELSEFNKIAWSWEDIRLYLFDNGYIVNPMFLIETDYNEIIDDYVVTEWYTYQIYNIEGGGFVTHNSDYSKTYEEARLACIKHCLELINNKNE